VGARDDGDQEIEIRVGSRLGVRTYSSGPDIVPADPHSGTANSLNAPVWCSLSEVESEGGVLYLETCWLVVRTIGRPPDRKRIMKRRVHYI
jgi:hypothetical protein